MIGDGDMAAFFDPADFGTAALYTRTGQQQKTVNGIFIPAEQGNQLQTTGIENLRPQFVCATADVPDLRHNDTFVISSVTYYCSGMTVDGTGITTIELSLDPYYKK